MSRVAELKATLETLEVLDGTMFEGEFLSSMRAIYPASLSAMRAAVRNELYSAALSIGQGCVWNQESREFRKNVNEK